jgi:hypothetical protein
MRYPDGLNGSAVPRYTISPSKAADWLVEAAEKLSPDQRAFYGMAVEGEDKPRSKTSFRNALSGRYGTRRDPEDGKPHPLEIPVTVPGVNGGDFTRRRSARAVPTRDLTATEPRRAP